MRPEVWKSFLQDTLRLCAGAEAELSGLESEASGEAVTRFFETLHTLKGTCSMVQGCEGVTRLLHDLEAELATRPAEESARDPAWVPRARGTIARTRRHLEKLRARRAAVPARSPVASGRGWLVRERKGDDGSLLWIPSGAIHEVLDAGPLAGRDALAWRGAWIPVLPASDPARSPLALIVDSPRGKVALPVGEVLGPCRREEAERRGAALEAGGALTSAAEAGSRAA